MFIYYHSRLSPRFFFSFLKFECDASVPTNRSGCYCLSHDGAVYMCAAHTCTHTKHHDIHCWKLLAQCNFALILCKGLKLYRKCLWCFFFGVRKRYCAGNGYGDCCMKKWHISLWTYEYMTCS